MNNARYSLTAIVLHWLMAALIVGLLALGLIMVDLPKSPQRTAWIGLHKSLGLCALLLAAGRLAWRHHRQPPASLLSGWQERLASGVHRALYGLMLLVPLAGYLSSSFSKYPLKFFGLPMFKAGWPDEAINGLLNPLHKGSAWLLAVLVALHIAGALHHLIQRDGSFSRMLPGQRN